MRRPTVFGRRTLGLAALPAALVATAGIVTASSYSVFTSSTSSPGNSISTGSVILKNDSSGSQSYSGSALFAVTNLAPNSAAVAKCVTLQSSGSLASTVRLGVQNATTSNTLAQYVDVKVEIGTATSTSGASCSSFSATSTLYATGLLSTFQSTYTSYATGLSTGWSPTGTATETRAFRITVSPDSSMTNTQQSQATSIDFVWEADNT